jgi:hypothetical protein
MARSLAAVFSGLQDPPPFAPDHNCTRSGCEKRGHGRAVFVAALRSASEQKLSGYSRPKPYRDRYIAPSTWLAPATAAARLVSVCPNTHVQRVTCVRV